MIKSAYIHEYGNGKLEPEHSDVKTVLEARGISCELFTTKKLQRNQLDLNVSTLVVGDHPTISTVFKRIGYNISTDSYPQSLRPYLKRRIWESNVRKMLMESSQQDYSNIFVKPKRRTKLFTGFVINSNTELFKLDQISKKTELYCSELVEWESEFRVFVNRSKIVGIKCYEGAETIQLDMTEVEAAINDFEKSTNSTAAYGIDFGVLKNGATALVEWNDGFSLGAYGLDKEVYTDLIISRWEEILKSAFSKF